MINKIIIQKQPSKSDKDVYLANRLKDANFKTGFYQLPFINNVCVEKPEQLVLYSNRHQCTNKSKCGLVFYEFDCRFDGYRGIYNILKYGSDKKVSEFISEIKDFAFVVCPDYSVYGDFPNYKQIDAIARSREVGYILSTYGIKVVINYRATFPWTYELALSGMEDGQIVAIGTLGALKDRTTRGILKKSIDILVRTRHPSLIIVYGAAPQDVFKEVINNRIPIWQYNAEISNKFKEDK